MATIIEHLTGKSISSIKAAGTKALSSFQSTMDELKRINDTIKEQRAERQVKLKELNAELSDLDTEETRNNKVIEKIKNIIE